MIHQVKLQIDMDSVSRIQPEWKSFTPTLAEGWINWLINAIELDRPYQKTRDTGSVSRGIGTGLGILNTV